MVSEEKEPKRIQKRAIAKVGKKLSISYMILGASELFTISLSLL